MLAEPDPDDRFWGPLALPLLLDPRQQRATDRLDLRVCAFDAGVGNRPGLGYASGLYQETLRFRAVAPLRVRGVLVNYTGTPAVPAPTIGDLRRTWADSASSSSRRKLSIVIHMAIVRMTAAGRRAGGTGAERSFEERHVPSRTARPNSARSGPRQR